MSFLDDIAEEIHDALAADFRDATLKVPGAATSDGQGGFTYGSPTEHACKAIVDQYSAFRRQADGIPANDRRIIVLGHGLTVDPKPGHTITAEGRDWSVIDVSRDPAGASWELQGR